MVPASSFFKRSPVVSGVVAACIALASVQYVAAAENGPPPLPEEAFAACQSKTEGEACSVQLKDHELKGTCSKHPSDARLFCRPSGHPKPPLEAFLACNGKQAADRCSVSRGSESVDGTCRAAHDGRLFCALPHPPRE